jgi:hypothetical protein
MGGFLISDLTRFTAVLADIGRCYLGLNEQQMIILMIKVGFLFFLCTTLTKIGFISQLTRIK